jgi:hypothetical protein
MGFNPCHCGHDYNQHAYSTQAPCTADGCECREFRPDSEAEERLISALRPDPPAPTEDVT